MSPKLSVIIPAYNAEKTIQKSIESVVNNSFKNLEILVIDDGSHDNTCQIVKHLAETDDRVKLISKANGGVSSARNRGIQESNAPYIMFLDSDDTYDATCCEKTVNRIESANADIVMFGYNESFDKHSIQMYCPVQVLLESQSEIYSQLIEKHYMSGLNGYMGSVWLACFKKSIIQSNDIRFNEQLHHSEDKLFLLNYLFCCERFAPVNETLYNYDLGDSSVTKKYSSDLEENHRVYSEEWNRLLKRYGHKTTSDQMSQGAITYVFSIILNEVREGNPKPFVQQIKKIVATSKKNKSSAKKAVPDNRSLKIKRFIAIHPPLCVMFFMTRRIQRTLGVYF